MSIYTSRLEVTHASNLLETCYSFFWFGFTLRGKRPPSGSHRPSWGAPPPDRVARRNRKRQPRKRRVHVGKRTRGRRRRRETVSGGTTHSFNQCVDWKPPPALPEVEPPPVNRFCRFSTWHTDEHVAALEPHKLSLQRTRWVREVTAASWWPEIHASLPLSYVYFLRVQLLSVFVCVLWLYPRKLLMQFLSYICSFCCCCCCLSICPPPRPQTPRQRSSLAKFCF